MKQIHIALPSVVIIVQAAVALTRLQIIFCMHGMLFLRDWGTFSSS